MSGTDSLGDMLVIGGGGHAKVVIDVARAAGFNPVAALDPGSIGSLCNGVEIVGGDDRAAELFASGLRLAVVAIGDNRLRCLLAHRAREIGYSLPAVVHPSAIVSPSAAIGDGTVVMPLAVINAAAEIGPFAIVNTAAVVEHDCRLGEGAHVAPGTRLGGCVTIGQCAMVGIGSAVRPEASVGDFATVGAGATVIHDIPAHVTATGTPARGANR